MLLSLIGLRWSRYLKKRRMHLKQNNLFLTKKQMEQNDSEIISNCIRQFLQKFPKGVIETSFVIDEKMCHFNAKVILDADKPNTFFSGYTFWDSDKGKAFERIKAIAIGRALALAGFEIRIDWVKQHKTDHSQTDEGKWDKPTLPLKLTDKATEKQVTLIVNKCTRLGISADARKRYLQIAFGTELLGELTKYQASTFIIALTDQKIVEHIKSMDEFSEH